MWTHFDLIFFKSFLLAKPSMWYHTHGAFKICVETGKGLITPQLTMSRQSHRRPVVCRTSTSLCSSLPPRRLSPRVSRRLPPYPPSPHTPSWPSASFSDCPAMQKCCWRNVDTPSVSSVSCSEWQTTAREVCVIVMPKRETSVFVWLLGDVSLIWAHLPDFVYWYRICFTRVVLFTDKCHHQDAPLLLVCHRNIVLRNKALKLTTGFI